jgi:hypothetical protein
MTIRRKAILAWNAGIAKARGTAWQAEPGRKQHARLQSGIEETQP